MDFYGTATGYVAYHEARGRAIHPDHVDDIETALLVASEWLDGSFDWPGYKVGPRETQTRSWPRFWVQDRDHYPVDSASVPVEVEHATYEVAFRWMADDTVLSADHTPERYKRVSIDGALSVEYRGLGAAEVQKQFPILAIILEPLLGRSGNSPISSGMARM